MTIDREEFTSVIEAMSEEQKRIAVALLPMEIIEAEQIKRYTLAEIALNDLYNDILPWAQGTIQDYEDAIEVINNMANRIKRFQLELRKETHDSSREIDRSTECSDKCNADHRGEHK